MLLSCNRVSMICLMCIIKCMCHIPWTLPKMFCCACDWNVFVSVLYISMNRIWDGITYFDCCRWRQHYPNTYHLIQKSFHQNITTTSEQCGRCLNPPNKSNMFNPLICTNKSLFVIEIILFITLHNTTNQQTLFNRLLIYAYKYYFKIIII